MFEQTDIMASVEAVAEALIERRTLSGRAVRQIIDAADVLRHRGATGAWLQRIAPEALRDQL